MTLKTTRIFFHSFGIIIAYFLILKLIHYQSRSLSNPLEFYGNCFKISYFHVFLKNYEYPLFSVEEIVQTVYTGYEITSPTNRYRKLIASTDYGISYKRGAQYCSGKALTISQMLMSNIKDDLLRCTFIGI